MSYEAWVQVRERGLDVAQLRVNNNRAEAHQDPGPGAQDVVRDIEKQHRSEGVLFRF